MACPGGCGGGRGKTSRKNGGVPAIDLPGRIVLVRYLGDIEDGKLPALVKGGTRHQYGTARKLFYVDGEEVSRLMAWQRNGISEFEVVV